MSDSRKYQRNKATELLELFDTKDPAALRPGLEDRICADIDVELRIADLFYRVFAPSAAKPPRRKPLLVKESVAEALKYTYGWLPSFHNGVRFHDAYYMDAARVDREYNARIVFLVGYVEGLGCLPRAGGHGLDFGAGDGQMIAGLAGKGQRWIAVEQSRIGRDLIRNRDYPVGVTLSVVASLDEVYSRDFSLILATDVIEHLLDPVPVLLGLLDRLAVDGSLFISVPNGRVDRHIGHLHFFTHETLRQLLEQLLDRWTERGDANRGSIDLIDYHQAGVAAVVRRVGGHPRRSD